MHGGRRTACPASARCVADRRRRLLGTASPRPSPMRIARVQCAARRGAAERSRERIATSVDRRISRRNRRARLRRRGAQGPRHAGRATSRSWRVADVVIEAVVEDSRGQREVVRAMNAVLGGRVLTVEHASIPIAELAASTGRRSRCSDPARARPVMRLVEIVVAPTRARIGVACRGLRRDAGKTPIRRETAPASSSTRCSSRTSSRRSRMYEEGFARARRSTSGSSSAAATRWAR